MSGAVPRLLVHPSFAGPLDRVSRHVARTLEGLAGMRKDSSAWTSALGALLDVARSPRSHLIRPQLVFLGYHLGLESSSSSGGGESTEAARQQQQGSSSLVGVPPPVELFASGVELQHLFMLVHDDVMDHGTIRRGVPTVAVAMARTGMVRSNKAGREVADHLATLVGDVTSAASLRMLLLGAHEVQRPLAIDAILDSAIRAGVAQFQDVVGWDGVEQRLSSGSYLHDIQEEHATDIASEHGFTAPLISGLRLCASVPEAKRGEIESQLREFGSHVGSAFVKLQDISDIVSDVASTGKDSLQDIREGRLAQPLFLLRKYANVEEWDDVASILRGFHSTGNSFPMTLHDRRRILDLLEKHRVIDRTIELSHARLDRALHGANRWSSSWPFFSTGCQVLVRGLRAEAERLQKAYREGL